jgi:hypothetical protein
MYAKVVKNGDSDNVLDLIQVSANEAEGLVNVFKAYGYEDAEGERYKFSSAIVEPAGILAIYVAPEKEGTDD